MVFCINDRLFQLMDFASIRIFQLCLSQRNTSTCTKYFKGNYPLK